MAVRNWIVFLLAVCAGRGRAVEIRIAPTTTGGLALAVETANVDDTIVLSGGRYAGPNNRAIVVSQRISIRSATGERAEIDCGRAERCLQVTAEGSGSRLQGITFLNGGGGELLRRQHRRHGLGRWGTSRSIPLPFRVTSRGLHAGIQKVASIDETKPDIPEPMKARTDQYDSPGDQNRGATVGSMLAGLRHDQAVLALLQWMSLSNAASIVSALPDKVLAEIVKSCTKNQTRTATIKQHVAAMNSHELAQQLRDESGCAPAPPNTLEGCTGSTTLVESCGSLTEGGYETYPDKADCTWIINPPGALSLFVSFSMLDIELAARCAYDSLSLSETSDGLPHDLGLFCGTLEDGTCNGDGCEDVQLRGFHVRPPFTIKLVSDSGMEQAGFALTWQASGEPPPTATPAPPTAAPVPNGPQLTNGGCLFVRDASVTLDAVHFVGGVAEYGGGLALVNAIASISNSRFSGNSAKYGGAIFGLDSYVRLDQSQIFQNQALAGPAGCPDSHEWEDYVAAGAGVFMDASTIVVNASELSGNVVEARCARAAYGPWALGAGIFAWKSQVHLVGSLVDNNNITNVVPPGFGIAMGDVSGGGLYAVYGHVYLESSHVTRNCILGSQASGAGIATYFVNVSIFSSHVSLNVIEKQIGDQQSLGRGGGVFSHCGDLIVSSSSVSSNRAHAALCEGGGIHWRRNIDDSCDGSVHISSSDIRDNRVFSSNNLGRGAGISVSGASEATLVVSGSRVVLNYVRGSSGALGGGVFADHAGGISVTSTQVTNNTALCWRCYAHEAHGGGIASELGPITVLSSSINFNTAENYKGPALGGGIYCGAREYEGPEYPACPQVSVSSCMVSGNRAESYSLTRSATYAAAYGGGIYSAPGNVSVISSDICRNFVRSGGANARSVGGGIFSNRGNTVVSSSNISWNHLTCLGYHGRPCFNAGAGISSGELGTKFRELGFPSHVILSRSKIVFNSASTNSEQSAIGLGQGMAIGGGVWLNESTLSVVYSHVSNNALIGQLAKGAGIGALGGKLHLSSSDVGHNWQLGEECRGGGVWGGASTLAISSSSVSSNSLNCSLDSDGGGIYADGGAISISSSNVSHNFVLSRLQFARGGGVFFSLSERSHELMVAASEIFGNSVKSASTGQGGGIVIFGNSSGDVGNGSSTVFLGNSNLSFNQVDAINGQGGSAWFHRARVVLLGCNMHKNSVSGEATSGGAAFLHAASTLIRGGVLDDNGVHGSVTAFGGGLWCHDGELIVEHCRMQRNVAGSGGGLYLEGKHTATLRHIVFQRNRAHGLGGGMVLRGGISLHLASALMMDNEALLVSQLFAEGPRIELLVFNSTFVAASHFHSLVQGADVELYNSSVWATESLGAAFEVLEPTKSSSIIQFNACPAGTYLIRASTSENRLACSPCPVGAFCAGGFKVYSLRNQWGWPNTSALITMARCPEGYCCPNDRCLPYDYCHGGRAGFLCGVCSPGSSEVLGAFGCQHNDSCNNLSWLLPTVIVLSGLFAFVLLLIHKVRTQAVHDAWCSGAPMPKTPSGERKIVILFFQLLPLILSTESYPFLGFLLSVFNFNFSSGLMNSSDGRGGWCPYPGFSVPQKITSRFVIPGLCLAWLAVFSAVDKVISILRVQTPSRKVGFAAHIASTFVVFGLAYSSLVQATFQLVACVQLPDRLVLFRSATVECFDSWQVAVLASLVPILGLWPALLAWLTHRALHHSTPQHVVAEQMMLQVNGASFDTKRQLSQQWEAVMMLQRLVLSIVSVFFMDPLWKSWTVVALLLVMLHLQVNVQPFEHSRCNVFMAACYGLLLALGAWEVGLAVFHQHGLAPSEATAFQFSTIVGVLTLAPFCAITILQLCKSGKRFWAVAPQFVGHRMSRRTSAPSLIQLVDAADVQTTVCCNACGKKVSEVDGVMRHACDDCEVFVC